MAVSEQWQSRRRNQTVDEITEERVFITDTYADGELSIVGSRYAGFEGGLWLYCVSSEWEHNAPAGEGGQWKVTQKFSNKYPYDNADPQNYEWEFDMSAVSNKIYRALGQANKETLPQPVERYEPNTMYRVSRDEATGAADLTSITALTGKLNDDLFLGFAAKTWLFLGAILNKVGFNNWRATYNFVYRPADRGAWKVRINMGSPDPDDDEEYDIYETGDFSVLALTDPPI